MTYDFKTLFGSTDIETSEPTWIINYPCWRDEYFKKMTLYKDFSTSYDNKTSPREKVESKEEIFAANRRIAEKAIKKIGVPSIREYPFFILERITSTNTNL